MILGSGRGLRIEAHIKQLPARALGPAQVAEAEAAQRHFVYGRVCFWAGGDKVGDDSTEVSLATVAQGCRGLLISRGSRESEVLMAASADRCFRTIDDALYADVPEQSDAEVAARVAEHHRFVGLPRNEDAFYEYKAYIVESGDDARFVWTRLDEIRVVHELRIRAGEFDVLLADFVAWVEAARSR